MADPVDPELLAANPAARLLELFLHADASIVNRDETLIKDAWALLLSAEDNEALLLRRLGFVYGMPLSIRERVQALPNENPGLLLKQMPKIESALQRNLYEPWSHFRGQVDEAATHSLELISFLLDRERVEPVVRQDDLDDLIRQIVELREDVEGSAIEEDLRVFLLRQLDRMVLAIDEVRLLGAVALRNSAEAVVGAIVIRHIENSPQQLQEEATLLDKLGKVAATALMVVNVATAPFNLAIAAQNALGPGQSERPAAETNVTVEDVDAGAGAVVVVDVDTDGDPAGATDSPP